MRNRKIFSYFLTKTYVDGTQKNRLNAKTYAKNYGEKIITILRCFFFLSKIVSEYDQEIPQSQTADNPVAPRGRDAQPSRDTRKTN